MNNTEIQQRAINKLNRLKVGALFMALGTGKTKVALDLMAAKSCKCDYFLWICPCSLKNEIQNEHARWQPNLAIEVVGCESIGSSSRIYLELLERVKAHKCVFCVVDESLKIKNIKAKRTTRILELSRLCTYKLILNGTPLSKNVLDVYTQMQFLSPLIIKENYRAFMNTYCEYYKRGRLRGRVRKQCNIPHLVSRIRPYIFDADLDLKTEKKYYNLDYKLDDYEESDYEDLKCKLLSEMGDDRGVDFYRLITALQQFICTCDSKQKLVNACIASVEGKVVVFVKYLKSIPEGALKVVGDMNTSERAQAIDKFKNDPNQKVLYITFGCGAFGLNLQFASNMIFADRTWDLAQLEQAEGRIYRLGQTKEAVNYYTISSATGLDNMMQRCIKKKADMLDIIKRTIADMNTEEQKKWLKKHL